MKKLILLLALIVFGFSTIEKANAQNTTPKVHPKVAMANEDVREIQRAMSQKSNDADKMEVFQLHLKDNKGITVNQIITLLNQYQLDQSKLNAAIFAYPYCVDYKDYMKIQDNFADERNKAALRAYVKKNGGKVR